MKTLPMIEIRQKFVKLAFDADPATMEIRQPNADVQINTTPAKMVIRSSPGELKINQSKAWDALGLGSHLEAMTRVYARAHQVFIENLARKVDEGNRMMDIHLKTNPIADIAREWTSEGVHFDELNFLGPASYDNVDISYVPSKAEIDIQPAKVVVQVQVNKPQIEARRGKFIAYLAQRPQIEIIPPRLDIHA